MSEFEKIINLVLWHRSWSLERLLSTIQNNTDSLIRVLGAEEFAIMGWDSPENSNLLQEIKQAISNSSNTVEFVCGGFPTDKVFHPGNNVVYWKTFWPVKTYYELTRFGHTANNKDFTQAYVSLNNKPWQHRCQMMDMLSRENLLPYGAISWNETNKDYPFKHWKQKRLIIDSEYAKTTEQYGSFPQAFFQSFMSLVNESTMDTIFPTEKTYTPIYFKKPFLVWSVPGFHKALTEHGFELYDEIFDYSFDNILDDQLRLQKLVEQVKKITNLDYNELYKKVAKKAERNYNILVSISQDKSLVPNSVLKFGGYENLIKEMK